MELIIYDKTGKAKKTVSPDSSSGWAHEVCVENTITVNFTTWEFFILAVGDYISIDGRPFKIKKEYRPRQINKQKYTYNLKFYGREHDTEDLLFCRLNQGDDDLESVFAYDGTPADFLQKVVQNLNRNTDGVIWKVGEAVNASRQAINFNGLYCWDALNEIARTFETEWWVDGEYLNLSKCERGEQVTLGYMQGLKTGLTQLENTNAVKWFTRLIPVGSTKNIDPSKYGHSHLQLPSRAKYIDLNTRLGLKEHREEAAFAEIFPHRIGTISAVRSEIKENEETGKYTIYYIKDNDLPFNPDSYKLPSLVIHISFHSGNLSGKDFECNWHDDTQELEIINTYPDKSTQIPGGNLIPDVGDSYILWNLRMPDEYYPIAEQQYELAVNKFLAEYAKDVSIYSADTDYIYVDNNRVPLLLGQRVKLLSEEYFADNDGCKNSRITRVVHKLNNLGEATIKCSNAVSTSWKSSVDSTLNNLEYTIASTIGGNGGGLLNSDNAATVINDFVKLKRNILVNSPKVGYLETGYVLMAGMTWEEILRTMLYRVVGAQLTGKLSTANDVEYGSAKGSIVYSSTRNGHGAIKEAWMDGDRNKKLTFGAEVEGIQTATRVLTGHYTTNETYRADVTYEGSGSLKEVTLTDKISVNVRRRWFAGMVSSVPTTSAQVRALPGSGLYTGAGSYKFTISNYKTFVICIPAGSIKEVSLERYQYNFMDLDSAATPRKISVEGANGSAAAEYTMYVFSTATTSTETDNFTFKTN